MALTLRDKRELNYCGLICTEADKALVCSPNATNGKLRIDPTSEGIKVTLLSKTTFNEEGMGGVVTVKLEPGEDIGVCALRKVSSALCTYFLERRQGK
jgi:hypothetical protein